MQESASKPRRTRGRRNDGLRKLCDCGPRTWAKCPHRWHFNFCHGKNPDGSKRHYRFSLDKHLGHRLKRKSEAETEAERIRIAIRDGVFDAPRAEPADALTLSTYAAEWLLTIAGRLKASTMGFYRDNLDHHVLPLLGARSVAEIKRGDCITLITTLRGKGLKIRTIRGVVRTLSTVLTQATDEGKLDSNPALNLRNYLKRGDEAETEMDPFNAVDAEHFAATARAHFPKLHPFVLCGLRTGMRLGELLGLERGDIDWRNQTIKVRRKLDARRAHHAEEPSAPHRANLAEAHGYAAPVAPAASDSVPQKTGYCGRRSSFRPRSARASIKVVSLNFTSWNQLGGWLRQVHALRKIA
jgi:integrase